MSKSKREGDLEKLVEIANYLNEECACADLGLKAVTIAFNYIHLCGHQAEQINVLVNKIKRLESSSNEAEE